MKVTTWPWVPGAQFGGVRFFAMDSASEPVWAPANPETEIGLPATAGARPPQRRGAFQEAGFCSPVAV
jgi:hypothetical protein